MVTYRDYLPEDCPPDDAQPATGTVYRMLKGDRPTPDDFLSFRELKPGKAYPSDCIASGLSVYTEIEGIRQLQRRVPRFRKAKVGQGELDAVHGTIKNTPSQLHASHHTWWLAREAEPWTFFSVIELPEDAT